MVSKVGVLPDGIESWCAYKLAISSGQPVTNHPIYNSKSCVDLILNVFSEFGYDIPSSVKKIYDWKTSNYNEAIHSLLFLMVKMTEPIGMDVMRLGSALHWKSSDTTTVSMELEHFSTLWNWIIMWQMWIVKKMSSSLN